MAEESRLGGLLGEAEGDEDVADFQAAALDPAAASVAMELVSGDAGLAAKAAAYFHIQSRLVSVQIEHLHEQREVQLSHLKLKRLSERLRVAWQMFVTVVAGLVCAYLLLMVHDAVTSRAVIVDPFDTPPALAATGLSGRVVAGGLLDQLTRMQVATQSSAAKRNLGNSWSSDIKVEVPETGLSLEDFDRLLRSRLGHDVHIGGDLVQLADGLELTVRGDGVLPKSFAGSVADLHRLTVDAGEYVYGQTQPALFAVYLERSGRNADALAFTQAAVLTAPVAERPYLLNARAGALSDQGGSPRESLRLERAALGLAPNYWTAYANAMLYAYDSGEEEVAWQLGNTMRRAGGGRPGTAPEIAYATWDNLTGNQLAARDAEIADAEQHAGVGAANAPADPVIAGLDIDLHDMEDARTRLRTLDPTDPYAAGMAHYVRGRLAEDAGDAPAAALEMEAWGRANADPAVAQGDTSYHCFIAPAEEAAGHPDRADVAFKAGGRFVDCYRWRADSLDHRGDWAGAQLAYAAAVALAPDLPAAYYSWGMALARHGDVAGAIAKFAAASRRGPHWADPLKAWGDALAKQGMWQAALAKYDAALRDAPAWSALRMSRDAAARRA